VTGPVERRATREAPLSPEVAGAHGMRTGWTTGSCAAAAAKAAVIWLATGHAPESVEVGLPAGRRVSFPVTDVDLRRPYQAAVVKDAGDDPDVTHGAHLTVAAAWDGGAGAEASEKQGVTVPPGPELGSVTVPPGPELGSVTVQAGTGVGIVTLPGLGLAVGRPAITAVPARMIRQAVREVTDRAVVLTLSVPGGEAMAARTSNSRLGIHGGVSILGTTGIVRPFSTAAWRASVVQQVDVAAAQGQTEIVVSTGGRTDAFAQRWRPDLPPVCFVEVGDFTGIALRRAASRGTRKVTFVGMAGKITKLAAGVVMTHYRRSRVDVDLLAEVARRSAAPPAVVAAATATATARHFAETCVGAGDVESLNELCRLAAGACEAHVDGALTVEVVMVDFEGEAVLARG